MRLVEICQDGTLALTKDLIKEEEIPAYAILSHTWVTDEEVTFEEFTAGSAHGLGYNKIRFCAQQAERDGLRFFWVDTCCINKADTVELQHAINSMFRWYRKAARCYVYLSDVPTAGLEASNLKQALRNSRWFSRGWTLQELLAPHSVDFFSRDCERIGTRHDLKQEIHEITHIPVAALEGASLKNFSVDERLSWSERRSTTREEDMAYSLLGIFGIFMFLNYGEGQNNAFKRLRRAIEEDMNESLYTPASSVIRGERSTLPIIGTRKARYHIPFPKNPYFVGRKEELIVLNQKLLLDQDCRKMSIVGLGGTGKTQIALRFAYTVKETMSALSIYWMPALSMESFEQACASIVAALKLERDEDGEDDAKEILQEHLSSDHATRWLMIVDNADDPDLVFGTDKSRGIIDFLPESENGITLFTTRTHEVAVSLTRGDVLELGSMSRTDAFNFLEKSMINKSLVQDRKSVSELLDELGFLPLAISQATAYLNMNRMTISKYLRLLKRTEQDTVSLMSKEFRDHTRYKGSSNAIASTWVVSFTQLQERDAISAELLTFMSCIEWKAIPRSLLPKMYPEEQIDQAIGTLCGYSFISRRNDTVPEESTGSEEWYDLHRLVHMATRVWISKHDDVENVTQKAIKHVGRVFPKIDHAKAAIWRAYMPHAIRLLNSKQPCPDEYRARLSMRVGECLDFDGRAGMAITWFEEACRLREGLPETHPGRLASQHQLGIAYKADGRANDAISVLERIVEIEATTLEETNPSRLTSQHQLAIAYDADGRTNDAIAILERIVEIEKSTVAESHPDRLASLQALAIAYDADGRTNDAIAILERIVEIEKSTVAESDPDRLASLQALGVAYQAADRTEEAIEVLERVVKLRGTFLAETHPERLASQHALSQSYRSHGRLQEAIAMLERIVEIEKSTLAESHPNRLASLHALGTAYQAADRTEEAIEVLERVVKLEGTFLAETHPDRLASMHSLSSCYKASGRIQEAVSLLEHVVRVRRTTLRKNHPNRLQSERSLNTLYERLRRMNVDD